MSIVTWEFESRFPLIFFVFVWMTDNAQVAELVDAHVSGACAARRGGSSPFFGTKPVQVLGWLFLFLGQNKKP